MSYEVEMKFRVVDSGKLQRLIGELGAKPGETDRQTDCYFNHPSRDFAATDEALRIRSVGTKNSVTYKGPKIDAETKTRTEIELAIESSVESAAAFADMLTRLGFVVAGTVTKSRQSHRLRWNGRDVEIALDSVVGLGDFVELETTADSESLTQAQADIQELAARLGLSESIRTSYLEMLMADRRKAP